MKIKIRVKLTAFLVSFIVISLVAVLPSLLSFREAQREAVLARQTQLASASAKEIADFIELQFQVLREVELLLFPEFSENKILQTQFLQRILFRHDAFVDLVLTDSEGNEIVHHNRYRVVESKDFVNRAQDQEFKVTQQQGFYLGSLRFEAGRPLLKLGTAVKDASGRLDGIIIAEIDVSIMQDVVKKVSDAEELSRAYIVDKQGTVVSHPDISLVLRQENFFSAVPIIKELVEQSKDPALSLLLAVNVYRNELGQEVVGAVVPVKISLFEREPPAVVQTDWFFIAELPTSAAFKEVRDITIFTLVILAGILLVSMALIFFLTRMIVRPIEKVHRAALELAQGRLDWRVEVSSQDEIQDLAEGFNQMAEKLKKAIADLEEEKATLAVRVEARTKELKELAESLEEKVKERTRKLNEKLEELERFHRLAVGRELKMIELKEEIKKLKENSGKKGRQ